MIRGEKQRGLGIGQLATVAAVVVVLIGGVYQVLVMNQRIESSRQSAWAGPDSIHAALDIFARDLREASPSEGDLTAIGRSELELRAARGFGIACEVIDTAPPTVTVAPEGRPFEAGDEVFVYPGKTGGDDPGWIAASVTAIRGPATCGADRVPAQTLVLSTRSGAGELRGLAAGTFLRGWEEVRYSVERERGMPYLVRSSGGVGVPLVGPLDADGGLELAFFDEDGRPTDELRAVRTAEIRLRKQPRGGVGAANAAPDSLGTVVFLRN